MYNHEFFGVFDVASLILTLFTLFFFGLVLYIRREDRREGYPLEDDSTARLESRPGPLFVPAPKVFQVSSEGSAVMKPDSDRDVPAFSASRRTDLSGTPLTPQGDAMHSRVGPGAFAQRARVPDMMLHGGPKIVPLRVAPDFGVDRVADDPRGMTVLGADGETAGVVSDVWLDKSEFIVRYLEVELGSGEPAGLGGLAVSPVGRRVLLPMTMASVHKRKRTVSTTAILASQFAGVPALEQPDQITFDEEERVCAYYGGGFLFATPMRAEPLI